jgi:hypothetical protein
MSSLQRRYEILLPQRFNDGQPVSEDLLAEVLLELRQRFGAVSSESQIIRGAWEQGGASYRDELIRVFVDVPDAPESHQFFREYKELLKARFQQIDVRITTYLIEAY